MSSKRQPQYSEIRWCIRWCLPGTRYKDSIHTHAHTRGGNFMHAGALDYAMHNYAQLCTIMHNYAKLCTTIRLHCNEDTQGLQTRGNLGLRSPTNRQHSEICSSHSCLFWSENSQNGQKRRISSSGKTSSAVEACAAAFCWTKLSMINTTTNCIGQEWSRPLCTIMHNYARLCNLAQL